MCLFCYKVGQRYSTTIQDYFINAVEPARNTLTSLMSLVLFAAIITYCEVKWVLQHNKQPDTNEKTGSMPEDSHERTLNNIPVLTFGAIHQVRNSVFSNIRTNNRTKRR